MLCLERPDVEMVRLTWRVSKETVLYASEDNLKLKSLMLHPEDWRPKLNKPPPDHKMYGLYCRLEAMKQKQEDAKRAGKNQSLARAARESITAKMAERPSHERLKSGRAQPDEPPLTQMSSMTLTAEFSGSSTASAEYDRAHVPTFNPPPFLPSLWRWAYFVVRMLCSPQHSRAMPHLAVTASRPQTAMTLSNDPDFADWRSNPRYSARTEERLRQRTAHASRHLRYSGYYHVPGPGLAAKEKPPMQTKVYMRPRTAR